MPLLARVARLVGLVAFLLQATTLGNLRCQMAAGGPTAPVEQAGHLGHHGSSTPGDHGDHRAHGDSSCVCAAACHLSLGSGSKPSLAVAALSAGHPNPSRGYRLVVLPLAARRYLLPPAHAPPPLV